MTSPPVSHELSNRWAELEREAAIEKASAINDCLAHLANVEGLLSVERGRAVRAAASILRSERDEILTAAGVTAP